MKTSFRFGALVCALISSFLLLPSAFAQGSLTPPGPPAPTMKTLDQVEARTPIDAAHAPGDATSEFIISQAGSYYLTGNLNVAKSNGIRITGPGVTVDLNGFRIARTSLADKGIQVDSAANNCTIKNGSITGFVNPGIFVNASTRGGAISHIIASNCSVGFKAGDNWRIDNCIVHDNTDGMQTGSGCTISSCIASNNTGIGIYTVDGSTIVDCTAVGNHGSAGISTGDGCTLTHCTARGNTSALSTSAGISTGSGCTITACTAELNSSTNATPSGGTGAGIITAINSKVQNCVAAANKGDGIRASSSCSIAGNMCSLNGASGGDGAGVHVINTNNRIEANNVISNNRGIDVDNFGNLIIKNSASGNTPNYDIAANNVFGAIVDRTNATSAAISGDSATSTAGTTDPWANISY